MKSLILGMLDDAGPRTFTTRGELRLGHGLGVRWLMLPKKTEIIGGSL